jgi:hypothetical protein
MHADSLTDLVKPLLWIAAGGSALGFCGYLALGLHGAALIG